MASPMDGDDGGLASGGPPPVDFAQYRARRMRARLLELLDVLLVAVERRDARTVIAVLDDEGARRWFPSGLREEALLIARLPPGALRAPMRAYRYYHQLRQLGEEAFELACDSGQLSLDLLPTATLLAGDRFSESASPPPDAPLSDDGPTRRRSGSR